MARSVEPFPTPGVTPKADFEVKARTCLENMRLNMADLIAELDAARVGGSSLQEALDLLKAGIIERLEQLEAAKGSLNSLVERLSVSINEDGTLKIDFTSMMSPVPILTGPDTGLGSQVITITIVNYNSEYDYIVTIGGGTYTPAGASILWTLPGVTESTLLQCGVQVRVPGYMPSSRVVRDVLVKKVELSGDVTVLFRNDPEGVPYRENAEIVNSWVTAGENDAVAFSKTEHPSPPGGDWVGARLSVDVALPSSLSVYKGALTPATGTKLLIISKNNIFNDACDDYTLVNSGVTSSTFYKVGNAMHFNGSGFLQIVETGDGFFLPNSGEFTIDCWIYCNTITGLKTIFSFEDGYYSFHNVRFDITDGALGMRMANASCSNEFGSKAESPSIVAGVWYYVAGVIDRSSNTMRLFVNNQEVAYSKQDILTTAIGLCTKNPLYCKIGMSTVNHQNRSPFDGFMDQFRISSVALWKNGGFTLPTKLSDYGTVHSGSTPSTLICTSDRDDYLKKGSGLFLKGISRELCLCETGNVEKIGSAAPFRYICNALVPEPPFEVLQAWKNDLRAYIAGADDQSTLNGGEIPLTLDPGTDTIDIKGTTTDASNPFRAGDPILATIDGIDTLLTVREVSDFMISLQKSIDFLGDLPAFNDADAEGGNSTEINFLGQNVLSLEAVAGNGSKAGLNRLYSDLPIGFGVLFSVYHDSLGARGIGEVHDHFEIALSGADGKYGRLALGTDGVQLYDGNNWIVTEWIPQLDTWEDWCFVRSADKIWISKNGGPFREFSVSGTEVPGLLEFVQYGNTQNTRSYLNFARIYSCASGITVKTDESMPVKPSSVRKPGGFYSLDLTGYTQSPVQIIGTSTISRLIKPADTIIVNDLEVVALAVTESEVSGKREYVISIQEQPSIPVTCKKLFFFQTVNFETGSHAVLDGVDGVDVLSLGSKTVLLPTNCRSVACGMRMQEFEKFQNLTLNLYY